MPSAELGPGALRALSLPALEELYAEPVPVRPPAGRYRGELLAWIDTPAAPRGLRPAQRLGFERTPFGVDFDRGLWFFLHPALALGRFRAEPGPSRWRDTETLRLTYERSRLPGPVRALLYDEIKPLDRRSCLGIGGIDAPAGEGDNFFFALTREA